VVLQEHFFSKSDLIYAAEIVLHLLLLNASSSPLMASAGRGSVTIAVSSGTLQTKAMVKGAIHPSHPFTNFTNFSEHEGFFIATVAKAYSCGTQHGNSSPGHEPAFDSTKRHRVAEK